MDFRIETMTCGGCARGVDRAVRSVDPEARVDADPPTRRVRVETTASRPSIEAALQAAGFQPDPQPAT